MPKDPSRYRRAPRPGADPRRQTRRLDTARQASARAAETHRPEHGRTTANGDRPPPRRHRLRRTAGACARDAKSDRRRARSCLFERIARLGSRFMCRRDARQLDCGFDPFFASSEPGSRMLIGVALDAEEVIRAVARAARCAPHLFGSGDAEKTLRGGAAQARQATECSLGLHGGSLAWAAAHAPGVASRVERLDGWPALRRNEAQPRCQIGADPPLPSLQSSRASRRTPSAKPESRAQGRFRMPSSRSGFRPADFLQDWPRGAVISTLSSSDGRAERLFQGIDGLRHCLSMA